MLSEKKKKNLPKGYLIFVLQFCFYSCNFQVPKGLEDLGLLLNFQKFAIATAVSEGNITVTGTVKDASGTAISGGILEISRSTSANALSRATADTKVYADTSGKFSMNIYAGSFSIKVSRSDGSLVGSFALKVTNATSTPEVSSATGLQVTGITAAPVGSGGTTGGTTTTTTAPVAFLSIPNGTPSSIAEGASSTIGVIMTGSITKSYTVTITSSNPSAISVSPASIDITPNNFSVSKQIVLTANQDENLVTEAVTITLSSPELSQVEFSVNATEDDYILSGTLTGLTGTLVITNNSGYDTVSLTSNGNFTFPKSASTYAVTVQTQPIGQYCSISNGTGTATSNVSNVTVTCLSCSGTTVTRNWGTFTDCNDGTVKLVVTPGTWGGATYTAKTLYYTKCTHGQTYNSSTNSCNGSATTVKFCNVLDNNTCNGGDANTPLSSGALFTACSGTTLAEKSWRVPTKDELRLLINCNTTTLLPSDNSFCTSGSTPPTINSLFPSTQSSDYWSSNTNSQDVTKAWVVIFNSGAVNTNSKTSNLNVRCVSSP